ncbi:MAG TPA: hypothetical protein VGP43_05060 [Chitinophagaceae bacterium]|nr:hypothetical protein [Chitinophagaceae bacterium]
MERVHTLIEKLQQQLAENASADKLLLTVQMIQAELLQKNGGVTSENKGRVAVMMPASSYYNNRHHSYTKQTEQDVKQEEKIVEVLKVDEKEIEEELEQMKKNAQAKNQMSENAKPVLVFDPIEDVPTLTHQTPPPDTQKNINESSVRPESLNEKLKQSKMELSDMLTEAPLRDLKKAIGVNDRFLFINELFRGDEAMYERSIKTINNFSIYPEAQYWIERELKVKIGWKDSDIVRQFDQLVKRRFT